jgi:hypothetical protein
MVKPLRSETLPEGIWRVDERRADGMEQRA